MVYIGSSIGNFSREEAANILHHMHNQLKTGVTAAFHLNVLHRLNRELGYNFDLDQFRYRAVWNRENLRVEKHIESSCSQQVKFIDQSKKKMIHFDEGETIHMEDSHKFTDEQINTLLTNAGFQIKYIRSDEQKWINIIPPS